MSVFDLPHSHMPPSYESHTSTGVWDMLSALWTADEPAPPADPGYRVDVFSQSCVIVTQDGKERILF